jgi:hypothetical protein
VGALRVNLGVFLAWRGAALPTLCVAPTGLPLL